MRIMLVAFVLLVGCVTEAKQGPGATPRSAAAPANGSAPASGDDVVCKDEAPTGSLLSHRTCRDRFEREGEHKNAENWVNLPRSSPAKGN